MDHTDALSWGGRVGPRPANGGTDERLGAQLLLVDDALPVAELLLPGGFGRWRLGHARRRGTLPLERRDDGEYFVHIPRNIGLHGGERRGNDDPGGGFAAEDAVHDEEGATEDAGVRFEPAHARDWHLRAPEGGVEGVLPLAVGFQEAGGGGFAGDKRFNLLLG